MSDNKQKLHKILDYSIDKKASDIHLSAERRPVLRIDGKLEKIRKWEKLRKQEAKNIALSLMNDGQKDKFLKEKEIDFSYTHNGKHRFRVNAYFRMEKVSLAMRRIPLKIKSLEQLNLPVSLYDFSAEKQGLVLVTGPASHGKSTTLAALIDKIDQERFEHIVTIEDPIEYVFKGRNSLIDQREIGQDTYSFSKALKSVFRQDPDVIMVGEMRDPETIETAITAAETGHLVFSTLHTNSATQTINRIVDTFPGGQQGQIRAQLSTSLLGVISQRLIPRRTGGLVPACEVLKKNSAVSNLIREGKVHELDTVVETSSNEGMFSLNKYLVNLVQANEITPENALAFSPKPKSLQKRIN